jgi:hypothetical protein
VESERGADQRPFLTSRLAESDELRTEVEAAQQLGISLKRFRGWEPTTTYRYDRGRLASSIPEVEWDEQQQTYMLALAAYRQRRCPGCAGDLEETTAPANEDRYKYDLPLQCFRCVAFARATKAYQDEPHPQTLLHLVKLRPKRR